MNRTATGLSESLHRKIDEPSAVAESFRALERNSLNAFHFLLSGEGVVLSESLATIGVLGYSPGELAGSSAFALFHPSEARQARDFFAQVTVTPGLPVTAELRIRHKLGRWVSMDCAASNLLEHPGVLAIALSCRDVTGRALGQEALRTSESQYRALFENVPDGILIQDAAGTCLNANPGLCGLLGRTHEELIGMNAADIVVTAGADTGGRERQLLHKDGSSFTAEVITAPVADNNSILIIRDLSERKQAERSGAMRNAVSRVLSDAESLAAATPGVIQAICEAEFFEFGSIWEVDPAAGVLHCRETWHGPDFDGSALAAQMRSTTFAIGEGLPGRVWASGEMHVVPNVLLDSGFRRGSMLTAAGLRGALAFPIFVGHDVAGVIDFAAREIRRPDPQLIEMFL
ncbi:MAG: PAS domain S-box protein, partial [Terriglobia bacterium]